jgi:hypothetical protein
MMMPYMRTIPATRRALGPLGLLGGVGVALADEPELPVTFQVYKSNASPEWEEAWALTAALLRRLDTEVKNRGARLAVVVVNAPEQVYADRWAASFRAMSRTPERQWDRQFPNRRLADILDDTGIPYLDLLPAFERAASRPETPPLHFRYDFHWTAAGHALAAREVAEFLVTRFERGDQTPDWGRLSASPTPGRQLRPDAR